MRRDLNRTIAAALLGISFGYYVHVDYVKWSHSGREAFIAYQTQRFDKYMAIPPSTAATIFEFAIITVVVFALYERIAVGVSWIMKKMGATGGDS